MDTMLPAIRDTCNPFGQAPVQRLPGYGLIPMAEPTTPDPRDVLQTYLDDVGLQQNELAENLHVDPKTVSRWMTGATRLTERKLRRVFAQLGVDPTPYGLRPAVRLQGVSDEQEVALLRTLLDRVKDVPDIAMRLDAMADALDRIERHLGTKPDKRKTA